MILLNNIQASAGSKTLSVTSTNVAYCLVIDRSFYIIAFISIIMAYIPKTTKDIYNIITMFFSFIVLNKFIVFGFVLIFLLISLIAFAGLQPSNGLHIDNRKFAAYDPKLVTELRGIVAQVGGASPSTLSSYQIQIIRIFICKVTG